MWAAINSLQYTAIELEKLLGEALGEERFLEWADGIDFEPLVRTCEQQLFITSTIVESVDFSNKLKAIVNQARAKLAPRYRTPLFHLSFN